MIVLRVGVSSIIKFSLHHPGVGDQVIEVPGVDAPWADGLDQFVHQEAPHVSRDRGVPLLGGHEGGGGGRDGVLNINVGNMDSQYC